MSISHARLRVLHIPLLPTNWRWTPSRILLIHRAVRALAEILDVMTWLLKRSQVMTRSRRNRFTCWPTLHWRDVVTKFLLALRKRLLFHVNIRLCRELLIEVVGARIGRYHGLLAQSHHVVMTLFRRSLAGSILYLLVATDRSLDTRIQLVVVDGGEGLTIVAV